MPLSAERSRRRSGGVVLVVVIFFALLLASSITTFVHKALIDHMVVRNRDARAEALAIARGGVRLATALLLEDKLGEGLTGAFDDRLDLWAQVSGHELPVGDGTLRLDIEDVGARLNLNSVLAFDDSGNPVPNSQPLLIQVLAKAIDEIPLPQEQKRYDPTELAANLIDYVDADEVRLQGGPEDDLYQQRDPPMRAANRPLLSVDELRSVEGFDGPLVEALRPYVTVYPFVGGRGINPNTAPPHVLALLFFDDGVELQMAPEDTVRQILRIREEGGSLCGEGQSGEGCTPIRDLVTNAIYPEPSYASDVFVITASGRVGDVLTRVEAVLDRSEGSQPRLLSWRVL